MLGDLGKAAGRYDATSGAVRRWWAGTRESAAQGSEAHAVQAADASGVVKSGASAQYGQGGML